MSMYMHSFLEYLKKKLKIWLTIQKVMLHMKFKTWYFKLKIWTRSLLLALLRSLQFETVKKLSEYWTECNRIEDKRVRDSCRKMLGKGMEIVLPTGVKKKKPYFCIRK